MAWSGMRARARALARALAIVVAIASLGPWAAVAASADPIPGSVVINEIHYHPATDLQEFVELHNPGAAAVDLGGACFTAGIVGCFPDGTTLAAGGFVVAAQNAAAYATAFPSAPAPALIYTGSLSNSGEAVAISSPAPVAVLDTVTYSDSPPWPTTPDGDGPSLELADPSADNAAASVWRASDPAPTPGAANSQLGHGPVPVIDAVTPATVAAGAPIAFTAAIHDATAASLEVTVDFDAPTTVAMADDGAHGDGSAGDGTYGATVPAQPAGTLVRYRALATNAAGSASLPAEGTARARFGLVVARPAVATALPVFDWYIDPADAQHLIDHKDTNDYVPAVVAVGGEVWDGAEVRVSGHARQLTKLSYKFKMPKGSLLTAAFLTSPVDEFVLDGDLNDASGTVDPLVSSVYADSNPLMAQMAKVHVERDGASFGLFTFTEEYDKEWRRRNGLTGAGDEQFEPEDIVGVLADDGDAADLAARYEKVDPDDGDFAHLYELVQAVDSAPTPARTAELRDLFDVPSLVEFLAVGAIVQHWDSTVHNYELLRDGATGRWRFVATDFDNALVGGVSALFPYGPDGLLSALRTDPEFEDMYLRRLRTLADRYLSGGVLQQRLDTMAAAVADEQAADVVRWPRTIATPAEGQAKIATYVAWRTTELLTDHRDADEVPAAPTPGAPVEIVAASYAGAGGAAADWVELRNPSTTEAIDLSGATLSGAGTATLPAGTVIPAGRSIVVPADEVASSADRQPGTFVAGTLGAAGLDDAGGSLEVRDGGGALRGQAVLSTLTPPTTPTPAGLTVEASADQVETIAADGAGVGLTVAVANHGAALAAVALTGAGTTCGRSLGPIGAGQSVVVRCATTAGAVRDRTYRFAAKAGAATYSSARVEVRQLIHPTGYWSQTLPNAPTLGAVSLVDGDALRLPITLAAPTSTPTADTPPVRWAVVSGFAPGRGIPTVGTVVAPPAAGGAVTLPFADGAPVRVAVAARNGGGTGARSALTPFLTPRSSALWPSVNQADLVTRVFQEIDGRTPTANDRAWAMALLQAGQTPAQLIQWRLSDEEWGTQIEPLVRLYAAYFGRPPDGPGLRFWIAQRTSGRTLTSISSVFAASSEFERKSGSLSDAAFVRFVYRSVLGREVDAAGQSYWTRRLAAGWTRGRVMTTFSESSEGRTKLAPAVGATVVWYALLGTPPTAAQAQPAMEWLAAGGSILTVIDGVRSSAAHAAR